MTNILPAFDLTGKIAVVTGGLSGMGLASARAFRAAGAYVVTNARSQARLDENQALRLSWRNHQTFSRHQIESKLDIHFQNTPILS